MARSRSLVKVAIGLIVLGGLGVLFVRSALSTRAEPYATRAAWLNDWRLVDTSASASAPTDPVLALEAPQEFAGDLFRQVFARSGESLSGPQVASIPLVMKDEFDRAFAGHVTPEALLAAARAAGLESGPVTPRCVAYRRVSAPGLTRQLYFVLFDAPAFARFREQLPALRPDGGAAAAGFDPRTLSPVLFIASTDAAFNRWLPLAADPDADCIAPLVASGS